MKLKRIALASWAVVILAVAAVAQKPQENPVVNLNGGLQAQIISAGMNAKWPLHPSLTMSIKITNTGKTTAFLLLYGLPSMIDDAGGQFDIKSVTGVAYCPGPQSNPPSIRRCVGIPPTENDNSLFSPRGYTQIDPDRSITATFFAIGTSNTGTNLIFSEDIAYRVVNDTAKDADLSDAEKLKHVQLGTLSFPPVAINQK
jgi:hypothetical protein